MSLINDLQVGLKKEFERRKAVNPKYSLRAFAKSIDMSVARLSEIMNNKRSPSRTQIEKISAVLSGSTSLQFTNTSYYENKRTFEENQFKMISEWIYLSILSVVREKKEIKISDLFHIFKKSEPEINNIIKVLADLKLLTLQGDIVSWASGPEKTSDQVPSEAVRKFHRNILTEAINKLETTSIEERDFSSMIMFVDQTKVEIAKEEIKIFRRKLSALLEDGSKNQVYALNIQLFPLSEKTTN